MKNPKTTLGHLKSFLMLGVALIACIGIFFVPAIQQDPAYHLFVDHRHLLGINNFWNVISNLPFVTLGLCGLVLTVAYFLDAGSPLRHLTMRFCDEFFETV